MRRSFGVACLLLASLHAACDSAYELETVTDTIAGAMAVGIATPFLFLDGSAGPVLPYEDINRFDRSLMFDYDGTLDDLSTIAAYVALLVPGLAVAGKLGDVGILLTYGAMYSEAFLLTMGTKDLLKAAASRHRPFVYFGPIPTGEEDDYYNSFPSGHTAFAFLGATFLATTLADEYPRAPWRIPAVSLGYALATGIGAVRILSGNHFATDVIVGALIGSLYGWLIPRVHLRDDNDGVHISISGRLDGTGVGISFSSDRIFDRWNRPW